MYRLHSGMVSAQNALSCFSASALISDPSQPSEPTIKWSGCTKWERSGSSSWSCQVMGLMPGRSGSSRMMLGSVWVVSQANVRRWERDAASALLPNTTACSPNSITWYVTTSFALSITKNDCFFWEGGSRIKFKCSVLWNLDTKWVERLQWRDIILYSTLPGADTTISVVIFSCVVLCAAELCRQLKLSNRCPSLRLKSDVTHPTDHTDKVWFIAATKDAKHKYSNFAGRLTQRTVDICLPSRDSDSWPRVGCLFVSCQVAVFVLLELVIHQCHSWWASYNLEEQCASWRY